jgi:hypothetical protein
MRVWIAAWLMVGAAWAGERVGERAPKLEIRGEHALALRVPSGDVVEIPWTAVTALDRADLPPAHPKPSVYKVWRLHERLLPQAPMQELRIGYTTPAGRPETTTVTIETAKVEEVIAYSDSAHKQAEQAQHWWGERYWKTEHNQTLRK